MRCSAMSSSSLLGSSASQLLRHSHEHDRSAACAAVSGRNSRLFWEKLSHMQSLPLWNHLAPVDVRHLSTWHVTIMAPGHSLSILRINKYSKYFNFVNLMLKISELPGLHSHRTVRLGVPSVGVGWRKWTVLVAWYQLPHGLVLDHGLVVGDPSDVTIVKHGENGQLDESEFGMRGEGWTFGLEFCLKVWNMVGDW